MTIEKVGENIIAYCIENDVEITNLKLQKLLFFYQRSNYMRTGELAFDDEFQAYKYGPVCEQVWKKYKNINLNNLQLDLSNIDKQLVVQNLYTYIHADVWDLVNESHKSKVWKKMCSYYKGKMKNADLIEEWNEEI